MSGSEGIHEASVNKPLWPEDTVEYRLYFAEEKHESQLTKLAVECTHFSRSLLRGHLWNYGEFSLGIWPKGRSVAYPAHLYGRTCFRDNIEDEWLIVYLLHSLSKRHKDLIISVVDGDGEFLLIEAAHSLPRWLKPETAVNRVFIHDGLLHIIPKPNSPADVTRFPVAMPTIREAIRIVNDPLIPTAASESVQMAVQSRMQCFSDSLEFLYHTTHCYLPLRAAHVISHDPQLVSAAVHALCDRDPTDTKASQRAADLIFSPLNAPCLTVPVCFTKLLYAKLLHEQFSMPRSSGFNVPPPGSSDHKSCDLGMKLTCGLEMLVMRVSGDSGEGGVESDPRWKSFIASLNEKGYFHGELEGSKGYQQLLASAKEYFRQNSRMETKKDLEITSDASTSAGNRISHILKNVQYSEEEMKRKWAKLKPPDDDSWLNLRPEDLDAMMQKYPPLKQAHDSRTASSHNPENTRDDGGVQLEGSKVTGTEGGELDLQSLVFGMKSFVDKVSSHKGAEFPWTVDESTAVNFDPDSFMSTLQTMIGQSVARQQSPDSNSESTLSGDDLSISSDESDLGEGVPGEDASISQLMAEMDMELADTELGKSFEKVTQEEKSKGHAEDGPKPVNVDFNLVKNLLDSYTSQGGGAGPASNILSSLGVHVPEQSHDRTF